MGIVYEKFKRSPFTDLTEKLLKISYFDIEEIGEMKTLKEREKYGLIMDTGFRLYHLLVLFHKENKSKHIKKEAFSKDIVFYPENQENLIEVMLNLILIQINYVMVEGL